MAKNKKCVELFEGDRRDHKQINRCNPLGVIAKEGLPGLRWPIPPGHHVDRNRGLGDINAQFEQLAMDPGRSPQRVLKAHSSNEVAHLLADPRSAPRGAGLPSPVSGKTHSMPAHDGLRSDNGYGVKNARTATIEPNEQGTAGPMQMHPAWRALLQNIELMPQDQDFSFEPQAQLEAVAQHADEKKGNCHHRPRSCSDSVRAATKADEVFGSDTLITAPEWQYIAEHKETSSAIAVMDQEGRHLHLYVINLRWRFILAAPNHEVFAEEIAVRRALKTDYTRAALKHGPPSAVEIHCVRELSNSLRIELCDAFRRSALTCASLRVLKTATLPSLFR